MNNEHIEKVGKKGFTYAHVQYKDGWADAKLYWPGDFDLVYLKLSNGKVKVGWHGGNMWDGLKVERDDEILYWKRKDD